MHNAAFEATCAERSRRRPNSTLSKLDASPDSDREATLPVTPEAAQHSRSKPP